jgi:hypothetical protein
VAKVLSHTLIAPAARAAPRQRADAPGALVLQPAPLAAAAGAAVRGGGVRDPPWRFYGGFCTSGSGCLILPTWNHLWFVDYLFVYTAALWLYLTLFIGGAAWARDASAWQRCAELRWTALGLALAAWLAMIVLLWFAATPEARAQWAWLGRTMFAAMQWSAIVAAIGFARVHLNRDHRWRATLAESVFPVYIAHQTLIILFAMALKPLRWAPAIEGPLLAAATLAASFGSTSRCGAWRGCARRSAPTPRRAHPSRRRWARASTHAEGSLIRPAERAGAAGQQVAPGQWRGVHAVASSVHRTGAHSNMVTTVAQCR